MKDQLIRISPDVQSGEPVFCGTRVPVKNLFDYLAGGDSLETFLEDFPSVSLQMAVDVLKEAENLLVLK